MSSTYHVDTSTPLSEVFRSCLHQKPNGSRDPSQERYADDSIVDVDAVDTRSADDDAGPLLFSCDSRHQHQENFPVHPVERNLLELMRSGSEYRAHKNNDTYYRRLACLVMILWELVDGMGAPREDSPTIVPLAERIRVAVGFARLFLTSQDIPELLCDFLKDLAKSEKEVDKDVSFPEGVSWLFWEGDAADALGLKKCTDVGVQTTAGNVNPRNIVPPRLSPSAQGDCTTSYSSSWIPDTEASNSGSRNNTPVQTQTKSLATDSEDFEELAESPSCCESDSDDIHQTFSPEMKLRRHRKHMHSIGEYTGNRRKRQTPEHVNREDVSVRWATDDDTSSHSIDRLKCEKSGLSWKAEETCSSSETSSSEQVCAVNFFGNLFGERREKDTRQNGMSKTLMSPSTETPSLFKTKNQVVRESIQRQRYVGTKSRWRTGNQRSPCASGARILRSEASTSPGVLPRGHEHSSIVRHVPSSAPVRDKASHLDYEIRIPRRKTGSPFLDTTQRVGSTTFFSCYNIEEEDEVDYDG